MSRTRALLKLSEKELTPDRGWQAPTLQTAGGFAILGITALGGRGGPVVCKEEWSIGMLRILLDCDRSLRRSWENSPVGFSSRLFGLAYINTEYKYMLKRQWERRPNHNKLLIVEFFCCCCCRPQTLNSPSILADPRWLQDRSHSLPDPASVKKHTGKGTVQGSEPP